MAAYRKILSAVLAYCLLFMPAAYADIGNPSSGSSGGAALTGTLVISNSAESDTERAIAVESSLTKTDGGPNSSLTIGTNTVLDYFHSTGATTNQAAANAILDASGATEGDILYFNGTNWIRFARGTDGQFLKSTSSTIQWDTPAGGGTVSSVGLSVPSWLSVSGSPVTSSGTLAVSGATGLSNWYVVGTNGSGAVSLQALDANHIPNISTSKITSGTLDDARLPSTVVMDDESNTYSGTVTQDMSASTVTLLIPAKAAATEGEITYNSNKIEYHNGTAAKALAKEEITISAGSGLSGGGDLSANRSIAIDAPVDETLGGTGQTTISTGDLLYGSASNTLSKLAAGTNGHVLTLSGGVPAWAAASGGGSLFKPAMITETLRTLPTSGSVSGVYVMKDVAWTSTGTITLAGPTFVYASGGSFTLDHAITGTPLGNGGLATTTASASNYVPGGNGGGLGGGQSASNTGYDAGGGGGGSPAGSDGGNGGSATTYNQGMGGRGYSYLESLTGSGGGSNTAYSSGADAGLPGGGGGTCFIFEGYNCNVDLNESITCAGEDGTDQTQATFNAGPGGGGGGSIQFILGGTSTFDLAAAKALDVSGGDGGNGYSTSGGAGAGGAGGLIRVTTESASLTVNGSLTVSGGAAGTGHATKAATAGEAGVSETASSTKPISVR